jgi:hypothetical protein
MNVINKRDERPGDVHVWHGRGFIFGTVFGNVTNDCAEVSTRREVSVRTPTKCNRGIGLVQHRVVRGRAKSVVLRISGLLGLVDFVLKEFKLFRTKRSIPCW